MTLRDFESVVKFASTANVLVPAGGPAKTPGGPQTARRQVADVQFSRQWDDAASGGGVVQQYDEAADRACAVSRPAESVMAVASGEVDFSLASLPSALAQIRAAFGGCWLIPRSSRRPACRRRCRLAEQGLPGFERTEVWFGLVVPSGTPDQARLALEQASVRCWASGRARKAGTGGVSARESAVGGQVRSVRARAGGVLGRSGEAGGRFDRLNAGRADGRAACMHG